MTPSCPIDRIAFSTVGVREQVGEEETGKAEVSKKKKVNKEQEEEVEEEQTLCEECRGGDREHLLLLCDGCDLATHTTCLTPPLSQVVCCLCWLFVCLFCTPITCLSPPSLRCLWAAGTALSVALQVLVKMTRHQHTDLALQRSRKGWRELGGLVQDVE